MASQNHGGTTRNAAPLLATFFTFLYALVPCLLLMVAGSTNGGSPYGDWKFLVGVFLGVALFFYLVRRILPESVNDGSFLIFRDRKEDPLAGYQPRRKSRRRATRFGTQKPATLEDIRAIRDDARATTWVPRNQTRNSES